MSHSHTSEDILIREDKDGAVYLTLNRPSKFNTLSENMLIALQRELDAIAADPTVRCVVIGGNGRGFCAGHDLREMRANPDRAYYQELFRSCSRVMQSVVNLPVPVIAKVQGMATAAGCQLVASCDLAIAAQSASFAVSGINVGLFCSTPAVALSRNITAKRAFDMLVTGHFIDADKALEWGLLSDVTEDDCLEGLVADKVAQILSKSPSAVRFGKAMFHTQRQMALADAYDFAGNVMAENMMSPDAAEGIDAFLEKRTPTWEQPGR
ncbi:enoyl-CoA hydratase [Halomonas sp. MCCC 1A17488]|uniref:enoyl-CoA hydratase n=1 Tax=unclassified Halomonas TaxID=2609666 RepID=UPI0018D24634|nr:MULTISPECIES: enoyl-CoA hydratase [unclassified Halomonas]MCE8017720.1 enoyl-CoA hydratase [Halomonas sp. MCCC 1A17488]MCG3241053.1 enoyl-CoA hydratase [Halomonas sp. MCCC 1A17488]QPP48916.1 enoyl-CoA hydratase [Halomonas sp. SS10-MC5]